MCRLSIKVQTITNFIVEFTNKLGDEVGIKGDFFQEELYEMPTWAMYLLIMSNP